MASRTRGHKVKSDLASLPLVRHIPSKALVSERQQPLYYEFLSALAEQELDIIQQSIAILIARHYVTMMEIILYRDKVLNESDIPIYAAPLDDLAQVTKAYSELVKTFYIIGKTNKAKEDEKQEQEKETSIDPAELLQQEIMKLKNDIADSTTE